MDLLQSPSSSSSTSCGFTYDVFLSFRGIDTRYCFTGNLYKAICDRGIRAFIDNKELQRGEEITPSLVKAIEESRIFIPVLSINYASSSFCLDELVQIMHCFTSKSCLVLPVFYGVEPSEVRHQTGVYGRDIANHEKRFENNKEKYKYNMDRLLKWKVALTQTASLTGYHFDLGMKEYEYEVIRKIADEVSKKINRASLHVVDYPVGPKPRSGTVKNDVNLHKDSIGLNLDPNNPSHHLISFNFDASWNGRIRIIYLAREDENCRFTSLFPQASEPIAFPFQSGLGQKFCQPSGTGIDLGLFELDDLSNYSPGEDVFPLVVCAEADPLVEDASPNMQIIQAVLYKKDGAAGTFQVKVVRQILWFDQLRYELNDIYGSGNSVPTDFDCNDPEKDCVICLIEPRDIVGVHCRHMSMCSECAKAWWFRSNKCPICHQPFECMEITR